jgi:dihydrolipoyl dehydrogenase
MDYDICIIGGGPAGYLAGIRAAQLGAKTAVIEMGELGGVCTNRGCIPTKALLEVSSPVLSSGKWADMGIDIKYRLDIKSVMTRMHDVVGYIRAGIKALLDSNRVDIIKGRAQFVDRYTLLVDEKNTVSAKFILIATGSSPSMPDIRGVELKGVSSSDGLFTMTAVPGKAVVIGGGAIGIEYATILKSFGSDVVVVEYMDRLLPLMDPALSAYVYDLMDRTGIKVMLSQKASGISESAQGLTIGLVPSSNSAGAETGTIEADRVFVATGRRPNTGNLGLDSIGVSTSNGWVNVNMAMRTSVDNVYAAGDVNGLKLLAHAAFHQGMIAVENMLGGKSLFDPLSVPSVVYSKPPVAQVGPQVSIDEQDAGKSDIDVKVGVFDLANSPMALVHGDPSGFVKVISDKKYGRILGASIAGEAAYELISVFSTGMTGEITIDELRRTVFAHPSLSEAIAESAWAVDGMSMHTLGHTVKKGTT